jgi:hypothetical protein
MKLKNTEVAEIQYVDSTVDTKYTVGEKVTNAISRGDDLLNAQHSISLERAQRAETVFLNLQEAQESLPTNRFRRPVWPGGSVRQSYSYSDSSLHRLFQDSSTVLNTCPNVHISNLKN